MSLDNVLAVAGAARDHPGILIVGLVFAVALMGIAANIIAKYIERYRWIAYVGLAVILWVAVKMIYDGWVDPHVGARHAVRLSAGARDAADTIFALSSGRPPAAIAVIRISGPERACGRRGGLRGDLPASARRRRCASCAIPRAASCSTRRWSCASTARRARPARMWSSFTAMAAARWSMRCSARSAAIEGLREAEPGEFTRRAFENGRIDLTEAEGLADLLEAETEAQRRAALRLAEGGLRRQIEAWRSACSTLSARAELAIDYVEEDEDGADPAIAARCRGAWPDELGEWLDAAARGAAQGRRPGRRRGPTERRKVQPYQCYSRDERIIVSDIAGHHARRHRGAAGDLAGRAVLFDRHRRAARAATTRSRRSASAAREREVEQRGHPALARRAAIDAPGHPRLILVHPKADLGATGADGQLAGFRHDRARVWPS